MEYPEEFDKSDFMAKLNILAKIPYSKKIIERMEWTSGENVMDYGCGPGTLGFKTILPYVERSESTLYSVDCSPTEIEYAKKTNPHPRISYNVGDILDLENKFPLAKTVKFDKIFAYHVLHHMRDINVALRGFNQILKPGGKFSFLVFSLRLISYVAYKKLGESEEWGKYMKGWEEFYPSWLSFEYGKAKEFFEKLLKENGFKLVHLEDPDLEIDVDDVEVYLDVYKAGLRGLNNVPKELEGKLREDTRKILLNIAGVPEDAKTFKVPFEYIACIAEKI